jgi:hypothetical protein
MNGDRAAHEVTQQHYIGNDGATHGEGEGTRPGSEDSQVEGQKSMGVKAASMWPI